MTPQSRARVLVFAIGNPSRGDDALGALLAEAIEARCSLLIHEGRLEVLTDFQLQVEHALDLRGRDVVVFADAMLAPNAGTGEQASSFRFGACVAAGDGSAFTHAMAPSALLEAYESLYGPAPAAWTLGIPGESFELGATLSAVARRALEEATAFLEDRVRGWCDAPCRQGQSAG